MTEKILFYLPSFQAGGAERQALNLAVQLKEKFNYKVVIAAQYGGGPIENECKTLKIEHEVIPFDFYFFKYQKLSSFSLSSLKAHLKFLKQRRKFVEQIAKHKPNFIFSYCYEPNVITGSLKKYFNDVKIIWNQRDMGTPPLTGSSIEYQAVKNAFKIVANSKAAVDYFIKKYPDQNNVSFIPNGVQLNDQEKAYDRVMLGFNREDKIIAMVANYSATKDQETLVKAFGKLSDPSVKLLLIGRFTQDNKEALGKFTSKQIHFHYEERSISSIIKLADLIVHASKSEGMPNGVLEAMYCECLVIASDIGPHKEILGETYPYLFKVGDAEDLKNKIENAFSSDQKSQIAQNKSLVQTEFSVEKLAQNYHKLIHAN